MTDLQALQNPPSPTARMSSPAIAAQRAARAPLHRWFEDRALRSAGRPAVVCEAETLTYAALNRRANRLARRLLDVGAGRHAIVGVCMERSLDAIVSILGVLKTGAAYLPMDPSHPRERLDVILRDAAPRAIVVGREPVAAAEHAGAPVVRIGDDGRPAASADDGNLPVAVEADDPAYVIYTSGSTGVPKGVVIGHRQVVSLFEGAGPLFRFDDQDVWTCLHSLAFDYSVWEIFGALLHGARLVVVPRAVAASPETLLDVVAAERVTVLNLTPGALVSFIGADRARRRSSALDLRLLMYGGEALDPTRLKPWFDARGETRPLVVNLYGITETSVVSTYRPMTAADAAGDGRSGIGWPLPGVALHLLDAAFHPVPDGEAGEIVLSGPTVGKGYLNRPELTAERFVERALPGGVRGPAYRSGDLGRRLPNGDVEYLGRVDRQVKVRGFRVETGEVEAALNRLAAVRQSVVHAFDAAPGDTRLAAYVVAHAGRGGGPAGPERWLGRRALAAAIRSSLEAALPGYMIPSKVVFLDAVPLTANGKTNFAALPNPFASSAPADSGTAHDAPGDVDVLVSTIWADVLRGPAGPHDNFFELGGHSLAAADAAARLAEALQVEVPVRAVLEHPTIAALAAHLSSAARASSGGVSPAAAAPRGPLARTPARSRYPLSFAQQAVLAPRNVAYPTRFNCPSELSGAAPVDARRVEAACRALLRRHGVLRASIDVERGFQTIAADPAFDLRVTRCAAGDVPRRRAEFVRPFDLTRPPLFRATLVEVSDGTWRLLLDLHHALTDAVSLQRIAAELWALYEGRPLEPDPMQYGDYALWQAEAAAAGAAARDERFWRTSLDGFHWTALPADESAPSPAFDALRVPVDAGAREAIVGACERYGASEMTLLLAALARTIARAARRDDVTLGLRVSRRTEPGLERMVGTFVEDCACRIRVPDADDLPGILARTKDTVLTLLDHPWYPYEALNAALQQERPTPNGDLFAIMVDYLPAPAVRDLPPGIRFALLPRPTATKYSLNLRFEAGQALVMNAKYRSDRYSRRQVRRLLVDLVDAALALAEGRQPAMRRPARRGPVSGDDA